MEASRHFVDMLRQFSPAVEQYSIDEAWVDMTGTERLWGSPRLAAEKMRQRIWEELGFTVNVGISSNKLLAKMAGDFEKPNKVHTLFPEEMEKKFFPLPVRDLFLVGAAIVLGVVGLVAFHDHLNMDAIKRSRLRIAFDPMYGVSHGSLRTILMTCRCDVDVIHENHDTLFGGRMPAPDEEALKYLAGYVPDNGCALGIATDGDADRLGVIDENGRYLHANTLVVLLYYYLLKYKGWRGDCVRNNSTTHLLDRVAASFGQKCHEVPVGFKHISAKMAQTGAIIGGESSGGMAVKGHIPGKDGIYAAALLVEMLAVTGKSVSELYREIVETYGELSYEEASLKFDPARRAALKKTVYEDRATPDFGREAERITFGDGCKVVFRDGSWVICRFSGTEPLLRIAAEAPTTSQAKDFIAGWKEFLRI